MEKLPQVAYFCMEYGLHHSFKQYAGGLGILAGDHLKGAHDEKLPLVGLGILWKQGYGDQRIDDHGNPYDSYEIQQYENLEDTGVRVSVKIRQRQVKCKLWKTEAYGNAPLYLLDTDLEENDGADRWITGQLYGWFGEERIAQEMVLGIGGIRALRALGLECDVYHFNEGHALFAGFELLREKIYQGLSFHEAWQETRREVVFTTHTPIVQGNESHPLDRLIYMGANNGLTLEQMVELGGAPFNMTVGALRLARRANAVAQLHGETANAMWAHVDNRCEILAITNAIHLPTWVDMPLMDLKGKELWDRHQKNKQDLIGFIKKRTGQELKADRLLIGFSRRAAPYKRSDFIFSDPKVVGPLFKEGKIQIVFSGKAHPLDDTGKTIVANLVEMSKKYPDSVVFLENYDMEIGAALTRGADVWLNNPRRPKEASGTSGMKAAINGVLNLSTLDGWWPEICDHDKNGWQFGDGFVSEDEEIHDSHDLKDLYKVLQDKVIPLYYSNQDGWIKMMQNSISDCRDQFAVKRMLNEYYQKLYILPDAKTAKKESKSKTKSSKKK
ncbi:MAG: alpha-glucan family phosphorylase [Spirochaetaceae bacterium]|nr:alpha-glucan family phosphorylase [Spirochaetaceae bacterium]